MDQISERASREPAAKFQFSLEYAPAMESTAAVKIKKQNALFIDGEFVAPESGEYFKSINPATGEELCEIAQAGASDLAKAVAAARRAYEQVWSKMPGKERGRYLFRIARILQERSREFAVLETIDGGKPISEARDFDIPLASNYFFYYAGWADKLDYAFGGRAVKPRGVCGQIIPWNFPLLMAAWKLAPALATGNTCILKPAETTSLTALLLAEVLQEAGLPPGVVNILTGDGRVGAMLCQHPGIQKIAFTGSTEVGKSIVSELAGTNKGLTLELGGKSANIIFQDAALDEAVEGAVRGIYFNQGHVCCAGSRLLIEESVQDLFLDKLKSRMETLRVGNPLDKNTDIGAINSKAQLTKIQELVALGKSESCTFYQPDCAIPSQGYYHRPCFFFDQSGSSSLQRLEIFGPVLSVQSFRTPEEAIAKANDSVYGLAAGIWSEKPSKVLKVASRIKAGVIWTNCYNRFDPAAPFGGYFESGWGREGGIYGLHPYVEEGV